MSGPIDAITRDRWLALARTVTQFRAVALTQRAVLVGRITVTFEELGTRAVADGPRRKGAATLGVGLGAGDEDDGLSLPIGGDVCAATGS